MPATRDEIRHALDARLPPHLYYCDSAEELGLGRCQCCSSHTWVSRADGLPTTQDDFDAAGRIVREADATADAVLS